MLTRAKSCQIVIGNPNTLKKNSLWDSFIRYCKDNGGYTELFGEAANDYRNF